jgi:hypothetical protein
VEKTEPRIQEKAEETHHEYISMKRGEKKIKERSERKTNGGEEERLYIIGGNARGKETTRKTKT